MARVTSVPDGVFRGAERVTVPLPVIPGSRNILVGNVESNPLLLVDRIVKFPRVPLVVRVKGTENGVPGTMMVTGLAYIKRIYI